MKSVQITATGKSFAVEIPTPVVPKGGQRENSRWKEILTEPITYILQGMHQLPDMTPRQAIEWVDVHQGGGRGAPGPVEEALRAATKSAGIVACHLAAPGVCRLISASALWSWAAPSGPLIRPHPPRRAKQQVLRRGS